MTPEQALSWLQTTDNYVLDQETMCDALVTVAGLHVQYAARVIKNGLHYIVTDSDEGPWLCGDLHKVLQDWHEDHTDAWEYADSWNRHEGKRDGTKAVVVARYVSNLPWEVLS